MPHLLKRSAFVTAYVALAAADAALAGRTGTTARRLRLLTKPALMPTLTAAMHQAEHSDGTVRRGVMAAQVLSWGGDVALLGSSERAFLGGLGSFFCAHLAYIATFGTALEHGGPTSTRAVRRLHSRCGSAPHR